jgi:hypothetical protein
VGLLGEVQLLGGNKINKLNLNQCHIKKSFLFFSLC